MLKSFRLNMGNLLITPSFLPGMNGIDTMFIIALEMPLHPDNFNAVLPGFVVESRIINSLFGSHYES